MLKLTPEQVADIEIAAAHHKDVAENLWKKRQDAEEAMMKSPARIAFEEATAAWIKAFGESIQMAKLLEIHKL
mgnify:CR=1 FL=1